MNRRHAFRQLPAHCTRPTMESSHRSHPTSSSSGRRAASSSSTAGRTYADALRKLALLRSNRAVTHLFDRPAAPAGSGGGDDLNAAAIPEMLGWLRRAGYSPRDLCRMRHIHVAGTKGKGSVCAYATAMLTRYHRLNGDGGGRVGTYMSPHLVSPRERIAIDGEALPQDIFAAAVFEVWDRLSEAARRDGVGAAEAEGPASKPFYFRFLTILAWHVFLSRGVRDVVIECGIGGEYDATNVLPAEAVSAAVVAQLGIDHVAMLGDTVEKIAWHKAGVFKSGRRAFARRLDGELGVMEVLRARAEEKGAQLVEVRDEDVEAWGGVEGPLRGGFQKYNQALAVMTVREHLGLGAEDSALLRDTPGVILEGLGEARLRGRGEIVEDGDVRWYLDGAHNKDSIEGVATWLAREVEAGESLVLVFNQQDRDVSELLVDLTRATEAQLGRQDVFSHALFSTNEIKRADDDGQAKDVSVQEKAASTMRSTRPECEVYTFDDVEDAVAKVCAIAKAKGGRQKVLVTGSMHLVGGVLRVLEPEGLL